MLLQAVTLASCACDSGITIRASSGHGKTGVTAVKAAESYDKRAE